MKDLPEEVLDEILGHLPSGDMQSFQNCSLVAKSWIYPSRRRLLEVVGTLKEPALWSWLNDVSSGNVELLQHVRYLSVRIDPSLRIRPGICVNPPRVDTPFFPCLKTLVLYSGCPPSIARLGVSLAPQHTLESLRLYRCRVTISTLATLINHFPNLVHLRLCGIIDGVDDKPIPPLCRPLRILSVNEPDSLDKPGILDQLMQLRPQCDVATISVCPNAAPSLAQRIVNGVDATLKQLTLRFPLKRKYTAESLSPDFLNERPRFRCRSGQAFDTLWMSRALQAQAVLFGDHGAGPHLDNHLHAHSTYYV